MRDPQERRAVRAAERMGIAGLKVDFLRPRGARGDRTTARSPRRAEEGSCEIPRRNKRGRAAHLANELTREGTAAGITEHARMGRHDTTWPFARLLPSRGLHSRHFGDRRRRRAGAQIAERGRRPLFRSWLRRATAEPPDHTAVEVIKSVPRPGTRKRGWLRARRGTAASRAARRRVSGRADAPARTLQVPRLRGRGVSGMLVRDDRRRPGRAHEDRPLRRRTPEVACAGRRCSSPAYA